MTTLTKNIDKTGDISKQIYETKVHVQYYRTRVNTGYITYMLLNMLTPRLNEGQPHKRCRQIRFLCLGERES